MSLAFVPIYIQHLGMEAYGLIGLFALLQVWLKLLDMGMTPTLVRELARESSDAGHDSCIRHLLRSVETIAISIATVFTIGVCLGARPLASSWLNAENLSQSSVRVAIMMMSFVAGLQFVASLYSSCLVGLQRQVLLNAITSVMATIRGLGAIGVLVWVSPTIQAFFVWQALVSVISLCVMAVATYGNIPLGMRGAKFSIDALRKVWRFASGMVGISLLALLLTQVDKLLLSKMLSLSSFGLYSLAALVAGATGMLTPPITRAWYPRLSQLHASGDSNEFARKFHQGSQLVSVIVGSASVVLIVFSDVFLMLWTRDPELTVQATRLVSLLAIANLLHSLVWIPYQCQLAHAWTSLAIKLNIVMVTLMIPSFIWIIPRFGAEGVAWGRIALNSVYVLVGVQLMFTRILRTEKWKWYLEDVLQPLLLQFSMVLLLRWMMPNSSSVVFQFGILLLASVSAIVIGTVSTPLIREQAWSHISSKLLGQSVSQRSQE